MERTFQRMAVSIFEKQNDELLLKCLYKQRSVYSSVKRLKFWTVLIEVGVVTLLTIVTTIWQDEYASSILTVLNMTILITSNYIERVSDKKQNLAAKIQQYFDGACYNTVSSQDLFSLNSFFLPSEIANIIADVDEKELNNLRDWYSDYSNLTPVKQILFCQNENISWDSKLRILYKRVIISLSVFLVLGFVACGIISNISFNHWLTIVSFTLVILDCNLKSIQKLNNDIKRLAKLCKTKNEIEIKIENNHFSSYEQIIELQNNLYEHRQNCFLIPDFVYRLRSRDYQNREDKIARMLKNLK